MTPVATFATRRRVVALATIPLIAGAAWGAHHIIAAYLVASGRGGSPMAVTFAASFLLLWWVPLSWLERPAAVTPREARDLDRLSVTVHVPVFNEDPATLRAGLASLLDQTRLPGKVHVVDDGSVADYEEVRAWFLAAAARAGIETRWVRTVNRGKRWAQMETLARDDADVYVTLDSDSTLDRAAIAEGLKPFADPKVTSVAGMIVVWNSRANFLTRLSCTLYTPFTRGYRSAQSMLGRVMVNSGTLAFYRADVVRRYAGSYERERLLGRPMQMNDDSMLTFYALMHGRTVHQPSSVAFTMVPERFGHYVGQQLRWMRGTFIRTAWWFRYLSPRDVAWWMPLLELAQRPLSFVVVPVLYFSLPPGLDKTDLALTGVAVFGALNYAICLRYFVIERSDETWWQALRIFALAPVAGLWRLIFLRPLSTWAMLTFWKIDSWGSRSSAATRDAARVAA